MRIKPHPNLRKKIGIKTRIEKIFFDVVFTLNFVTVCKSFVYLIQNMPKIRLYVLFSLLILQHSVKANDCSKQQMIY